MRRKKYKFCNKSKKKNRRKIVQNFKKMHNPKNINKNCFISGKYKLENHVR